VYKTFEFRLFLNRSQHALLLSCLAESRHLHNEMLELLKAHYENSGTFLGRNDLTYRFKGRSGEHVPQSTVQTLADRLDRALKRFFRRRELGQKVGFPRFKGANRWHSIRLRQYGPGRDVYLDPDTGRLRVPKKLGSRLKVKQHRPLEGTPKTAHLVYRADGHWYVLIVCDLGDAPHKCEGAAVGLDLGLTHFIADSEGQTVENPRCFERAAKRLRRAQRKTARRKKGSHRRRKASKQAAKQHLKIARQRKDHAHKTARKYVDSYAFIAVEDLRVGNMLKNRQLARAIADASWTAFIDILTLKAEYAGARVFTVSPRFTSQRCSECGENVRRSLSVRTHICESCGYVADRDHNAARNILRAGMRPSERNVGGYPERVPRSRLLKQAESSHEAVPLVVAFRRHVGVDHGPEANERE
jgi:putative transposase